MIFIPGKHQAAKANGAPLQSELRKAANKVFGVKHENGVATQEHGVLTEKFSFGLSQALLEECHSSRPGKFLLELLSTVAYAGNQNRPVMLVGRKVRAGGFHLTVVVPVDLSKRPGPVPIIGAKNSDVTPLSS